MWFGSVLRMPEPANASPIGIAEAALRTRRGLGPLTALIAITVLLATGAVNTWAQDAAPTTQPAPVIDERADALLHQACDLLASATQFTFEAHCLSDQVLPSGQKVQFARNEQVAVRRPGMIRASIQGDLDSVEFWCDGKRCGLYDKDSNTHSTADAPPTIDAVLDGLADKYGIAVPLADVLISDPYKSLMSRARSGVYLGTGRVFDTMCHHLAYRQDGIDWEIWIDAGPQPLICKLVITYTDSPACPQYMAFFSKWDLNATLPGDQFAFIVPAGATEIPFAPSQPPAAPNAKP
jgi:hypothetical protein